MGGSQSAPAIENVVREDPYPGTAGTDGLSLSQAEKCNACRLGVNTKITTSNVKLKREQGAISIEQCKRYTDDMNRVNKKTLSVPDFLSKLKAGEYSRSTSDAGSAGDQYCQELSVKEEDAESMREKEALDPNKFIGGSIRKVSGSSFSEETKGKFIPSIPFQMSFTAKKAALVAGKTVYKDVSDDFTVSQMTMYHPSPIRIDAVQADAMLSLNDPSDKAAKYIILIPLKAVNSGNPSNEFLNKIARHLQTVREPRPDTGEYLESTIATGADWALDKLFTLTGEAGSSTVKNGFFTWTGVAGYDRVNLGTTRSGNKNITVIGWKQTEGLSSPQYVLLDTPLDINPEDMAMLTQSLPVTPPSEAIHSVPAQTNLVYYKGSEPPAPDSMSGKPSCGSGNLCEGFTTGVSKRERFEGCPGAKCDPFLQNAAKAQEVTLFSPSRMFAFFFGFLTVVAMFLGAYLALSLVRDDYDLTLRNFAEQAGQVLAVWAKSFSEKVNTVRSGFSLASGNGLKGLLSGNVKGVTGNLQGALQSQGNALAGNLEGALQSQGNALAQNLTPSAEGAIGNAAGSIKNALQTNGKSGLGTTLSSSLGNLFSKTRA